MENLLDVVIIQGVSIQENSFKKNFVKIQNLNNCKNN